MLDQQFEFADPELLDIDTIRGTHIHWDSECNRDYHKWLGWNFRESLKHKRGESDPDNAIFIKWIGQILDPI